MRHALSTNMDSVVDKFPAGEVLQAGSAKRGQKTCDAKDSAVCFSQEMAFSLTAGVAG